MKKLILILITLFMIPVYAGQSMLVYDNNTGRILYQQDANQIRPLASITKLMTAMVTLDYDKDLTRHLQLSRRVGATLPRQTYSRYELLTAMLIRSDNAAAETLAEDYPGGRQAFINAMNDQAKTHGMIDTRFDDPTGLSAKNVSTATDIALLMDAASGYWVIRETSIKRHADFRTNHKKPKIVTLRNTNDTVLRNHQEIVISKTGFTTRAGWCVSMLVERNKHSYTIVVLGAKNKQQRVDIVDQLMYNHIRIPSSPSW